jgi:hypothetical protein
MQRAVLSAIVLGVLGACSAAAEKEAANLSLACQFSRCDCVSNSFLFFDTQPVVWKQDGTASCPVDYHLRRLEAPPSKPM